MTVYAEILNNIESTAICDQIKFLFQIFENKGSVVHYLLAPDSDEPSGKNCLFFLIVFA